MENYRDFKSEYLKSMLCLVLGFRGNIDMIEFLIKEAERLEREYPNESFDQGPALAVQELAVRFLNWVAERCNLWLGVAIFDESLSPHV